jgi:hypothetical protein
MEFLEENWVKTSKGDYVSKKDLNDDMSTSFEDLLSSMKLELEQDSLGGLGSIGGGGAGGACMEVPGAATAAGGGRQSPNHSPIHHRSP